MGEKLKLVDGGTMQGFATKPMKRVRVAMIGIGSRGFAAVKRIVGIPGLEITAIADNDPEKLARFVHNAADLAVIGQHEIVAVVDAVDTESRVHVGAAERAAKGRNGFSLVEIVERP